MKALSLIKFMTFVSMFMVTCATAWGQPSNGQISFADPDGLKRDEANRVEARLNTCKATIKSLDQANGKATTACLAGGFGQKDCSSALNDCNEASNEEQAITFPPINGIDIFSLSNTGGEKTCSTLNNEQYNTEQDRLDRKEEKITDELSRLKKDQERDEEKYQEDAAKLQKEVSELIDEKSKAELEDKENDRKAEGEEKVALDDLRKQIRKLENEVLSAMGKLKELANLRSRQATGYRKKVLLCKLEAEKAAAERKKMPKQSGNLNSATKSGSSNNQVIQEIYQTCVQDVLTERTSDEDTYQTQLTNVNKFIADTETEIKELKASEQLAIQQSAQAKIDKENNRKQRDQSFLQKYQSMLEQRKASDNLMTQKRSRAALEVNKAQQKATEASNKLASFGMKKPIGGSKKFDEIQDAVNEAERLATSCETDCAGLAEKEQCYRYKKPGKSSSKPATTGGADSKGP